MNRVDVVIAVTMVACTILEVIVTLAILVYYHNFQITSISAVWGLAIVSSIATSVLVIMTALQMLEARRLRIESVRPSLSLEPAGFVTSGGFTMLHLANNGNTARDVNVDVTYNEKTDLHYISSIGTSQRVPVLIDDDFTQAGGAVVVMVRYTDLYGKAHEEKLSIDFNSINKENRRYAYVRSPIDVIASKIDDLERTIDGVERTVRGTNREIREALRDIERKIQ
jgi:hypothetical protein